MSRIIKPGDASPNPFHMEEEVRRLREEINTMGVAITELTQYLFVLPVDALFQRRAEVAEMIRQQQEDGEDE